MPEPKFISIGGKRGAGKGEVANHLHEAYGYTVLKLASPLKNMLRVFLKEVLSCDDDAIERCIEGDLKEAAIASLQGISPRVLMQTLGTEWAQSIYPGMWVNVLTGKAVEVLHRGGKVAVDDMRFPHEADVLSRCGAELWLVEADRDWRLGNMAATKNIGGVPAQMGEKKTLGADWRSVASKMTRALFADILPEGAVFDWSIEVPATGYKTPRYFMNSLVSKWLPEAFYGQVDTAKFSSEHKSERPLSRSLFAKIIENNGTIAELQQSVDAAMRGLERRKEDLPPLEDGACHPFVAN
jgi:hypothetical protein